MGAADKDSIWSPESLFDEKPVECLMKPVPVSEGRRMLADAGFSQGPNTGVGYRFEIWITPTGAPQMVPYFDDGRHFDGEELADALRQP